MDHKTTTCRVLNAWADFRLTPGRSRSSGGPLSPLLANVMLDVLDKELERRGHKFCRYADDCNIYVKSRRAGMRVMESVRKFVEKKLRLRINAEKSAVDRPANRKFLGFNVYRKPRGGIGIGLASRTKERLRAKLKELTSRRIKEMGLLEIERYYQKIRNA